ncbi:hypothetical protein LCGC14_0964730 [marine sediment metagenome]|uniref:Uncharacterized protein n=1 Tax=marine sediment metagenome TaxID=412755 RepID=A0A0F9RJY9_9ZZZZ
MDFYDLYLRSGGSGRMRPFWVCYVEGINGGKHLRHFTLWKAREEAARLASLTNKTVYVFECIGKCGVEIKWQTPLLI